VPAPTALRPRSLITCLLVALPLAIGCGGGDRPAAGDSPLPPAIHGLPLVEQHEGREAAEILGEMHEQDVAPSESYIGHYGTDAMGAVVYISRFGSPAEADSQQVAMATGIRRADGASGYGHHSRFRVTGKRVDMVFGFGQIHYFYAEDERLMWVGAHPAIARAALAELMNVPLDSVRTVEDVTGIRRPVTS
jgi:hypothetical protein